jgi:hypothetical protein
VLDTFGVEVEVVEVDEDLGGGQPTTILPPKRTDAHTPPGLLVMVS